MFFVKSCGLSIVTALKMITFSVALTLFIGQVPCTVAALSGRLPVGTELANKPTTQFQNWHHGKSVTHASGDFLYVELGDNQRVEGVIVANRPPLRIESTIQRDTVIFQIGQGTMRLSGNRGVMILNYGPDGRMQQRNASVPNNATDPVGAYRAALQRYPRQDLRQWLKQAGWPTPTPPAQAGNAPTAAKPDNARPSNHSVATLSEAIRRNLPDAVRHKLKSGADPNKPDANGYPPLIAAIRYGRPEIVHVLLDHKASINAVYNKMTVLHAAIMYRSQPSVVEALLKAGADLEATNARHETPLMAAVFYRRYDIAKLLIAKGASVNVTDRSGQSLLHHAVDDMNAEIVELLVRKGANINAVDRRGQNPLAQAKERCEKLRQSLARAEAVVKALEQVPQQ